MIVKAAADLYIAPSSLNGIFPGGARFEVQRNIEGNRSRVERGPQVRRRGRKCQPKNTGFRCHTNDVSQSNREPQELAVEAFQSRDDSVHVRVQKQRCALLRSKNPRFPFVLCAKQRATMEIQSELRVFE